jgi:hypothetical protein
MKKRIFPDFTGKCVSVTPAGQPHTYTIECPQLEMQHGRLFLIGIVPRGISNCDWSEGAVCAIAWDQVSTYLVFDSAKDYLKRLSKFEKNKRKA